MEAEGGVPKSREDLADDREAMLQFTLVPHLCLVWQ